MKSQNIKKFVLTEPIAEYQEFIAEKHLLYIYQNYIYPWSKRTVQKRSTFKRNKNLRAVIIDTRVTDRLLHVIGNMILMLPYGTKIDLITSLDKKEEMNKLIENWDLEVNLRTFKLNAISFNIDFYNQMMTSDSFWSSFREKRLLIFQQDSIMFRQIRQGESYNKYGYIGAPWSKNGQIQSLIPKYTDAKDNTNKFYTYTRTSTDLSKLIRHNYGNGGFSLRDPILMKQICLENSRNLGEQEDIFFSRHLDKYNYPIADIDTASKFAVEWIFNDDPVGCHKSWYYLEPKQQAFLLDKHLRNVIGMTQTIDNPD